MVISGKTTDFLGLLNRMIETNRSGEVEEVIV